MDVACYTFPHYHRSAYNDRVYGPGWTEYSVMRGGHPWFPGHSQPKVPLLGELDEAEPATWEVYTRLAVEAGITTFIWDWYWYDGEPVFHEALERGFLQAPGRERIKFAVMWVNYPWVTVTPTIGSEPEIDHEFLTQFTLGRGARDLLAPAVGTVEECWQQLSYLVARFFHDPCYWRLAGEPVLAIWEPEQFISLLGGTERTREFLGELRQFAAKLGHDGIHVHTPGNHAVRDLAAAGFSSYGAYNPLYYAVVNDPAAAELVEYGRAYRHVVENFWPALEDASPLPFFPAISPGFDTTPRAVEPGPTEKPPHADRWPGHPFVVNESPELFEQFTREALKWVETHPDAPRVLTIACWNEWTEGHYLLPDTRFGYGMLRALQRALDSGLPETSTPPDRR